MKTNAFASPQVMTRHNPKDKEKSGPNVMGGASGAMAGAKAGGAIGSAAAPVLAMVPGIGPALAAAAPVAGKVIGGVAGGLAGATSQKQVSGADLAKQMQSDPKSKKGLRAAGARRRNRQMSEEEFADA